MHASEQLRPDVQLRRADWCAKRSRLPAEKLVFIDETSLKTNLIRMYGRARRGQRVVDYAPHGHWKTTTLVSALRSHELTAPMVIDGALDGSLFLAYVGQVLLPTLQPGDVVVLDNLSSHKSKRVQELIESAGASVAYPSLLPDVWKQQHPEAVRAYRVEERRDKAERKQLNAARRRLVARDRR